MPQHHFTTPRVIYLGRAHGSRDSREQRTGVSAPRTTGRATPERIIERRPMAVTHATLR